MTGHLVDARAPLSILSDRLGRKIVGSIVYNAIRQLPDKGGDNMLIGEIAVSLATDFENCEKILKEFRLTFPKEWMFTDPKSNSENIHLSMLAFLGHVLFLFPTKSKMKDALSSQEASYRKARGLDDDNSNNDNKKSDDKNNDNKNKNDDDDNAKKNDVTANILLEFGKLLREDPFFEGLESILAKKFPHFILGEKAVASSAASIQKCEDRCAKLEEALKVSLGTIEKYKKHFLLNSASVKSGKP